MADHIAYEAEPQTEALTLRAEAEHWRPTLLGRLLAPWRGLVLLGLGLLSAVTSWLLLISMCLMFVWLGFALVPEAARGLHALAGRQLELGRRWYGMPPTAPGGSGATRPAFRSTSRPTPPLVRRVLSVLRSPATWCDLGWAQLAATFLGFLALLPFALLVHGALGIALPFLWESVAPAFDGGWFLFVPLSARTTHMAAGVGVAELLLGLWAGPYILRAQSRLSQTLLCPSGIHQ
ncbi:Putative sensor [Streptomyces noursei ATCC 11455]|uniref:sensor domain-containing protein n=1 Tax=Streptomyces noursei TaxID=1971 RepID=UPI00081CBDD0|nr:Putative sensor [Streptomyces noursei ATCC 11455]